MAILSFVFSFTGILSPVALILGIVALATSFKHKDKKHGLAIAGIILGIVFSIVAFFVFLFIYGISSAVSGGTDNTIEKLSSDTKYSKGGISFTIPGEFGGITPSLSSSDHDSYFDSDVAGIVTVYLDEAYADSAKLTLDDMYDITIDRFVTVFDGSSRVTDRKLVNRGGVRCKEFNGLVYDDNGKEQMDLSGIIIYNDKTHNCKLNILFNPLDTEGEKKNNTSVCCLITYYDQKLLFTGDLETKGEDRLIKTHGDLLEDVTFFKANHHGSHNANSEKFIDTIRPGYVAITKSTNQNYTYIVDSVNNFLKYTDYIYPTHITYYKETRELFGESVFYFDGKNVRVETEKSTLADNLYEATFNYNGRSLNWYDTVIADSDSSNGQQLYDSIFVYTFDEGREAYNGCTLIKHGHTDIIIDCGSNKPGYGFVDKLKDYVTDGVIEYLIVTNHSNVCISQLVDSKGEKGVFDNFEVENVIEGSKTVVDSFDEHPTYDLFISEVEKKSNRIVLELDGRYEEEIIPGYKLFVSGSNNNSDIDENALSLYAVIEFNKQKLVFVGNQVAYDNIKNANGTNIKNVAFMRLPSTPLSMEDMKGYEAFLKNAAPKFSTIGSPVDYTLSNGQVLNSADSCIKTLRILKGFGMSNIYPVGYMSSLGGYINENKDMVFSIKYDGKDSLIGMEKEYKCLESMIGK